MAEGGRGEETLSRAGGSRPKSQAEAGRRGRRPAPEEALDLAEGGLRTAPDGGRGGHSLCVTAANGGWEAGPGPGNCPPPGHLARQERKQGQDEGFTPGAKGGGRPVVYGFGSDQRWEGAEGRQWCARVGRGAWPASGQGAAQLPVHTSPDLTHPQGVQAAQTLSQTLSFLLW